MKIKSALSALALVAALALAASTSALADTETFKIDPGHSTVGFKVSHILAKVSGRFTKYSGTIAVDQKDLSTAKIAVEIDAASVNTDNEGRDKDLHFESTAVVPNGANKATLKGNLTLHGVTKPVDLDVDVLGFASDPWGGYRAAFEARTTINRKDFGMTYSKILDNGGLLVGEKIEITLDIEAVRQKPEAH